MSRLPVLVAGVPRSGSSWVVRVLGSTPGAVFLGEPDNHEHSPFALRAKVGLPGRFYSEVAIDDDAPAYEALWAAAFGARGTRDSRAERVRRQISERLLRQATAEQVRRSFEVGRYATAGLRVAAALAVPERPPPGNRVVVKSVHAPLALEWLAARFAIRVAVVLREPLNVLASWKQMGWLEAGSAPLAELDPETARRLEARYGVAPVEGGSVEQAAHVIALLHTALAEAARRHPDWVVLSHEDLCTRPHDAFREAAGTLGLGWDATGDALLTDLDRPGTGYDTSRVAAGLPGAWRSRLAPDEQDAARSVFDRFHGLEVT